ncbi:MAG TPA: YfhO family protein [Thermoanaerobaculia bacterium]|nr:YfhO family protein [Thermoanaerobaculia bacterium]
MNALHLAWGLGLALLLGQAAAWCLARCLSVALPWRIQALGACAPLALLLPLLAGHRLLAPTDAPIPANLPDAPRVEQPDVAHGVFNDAILQLLPWEAEVRRGFAEGHLPLWSDLLDGGSSPWINPQAAVLSPIAMLGRLLPLEHFLLGMLAVKILLAFEGCWLLARTLGAGRFSAVLAAGGFALGGPVLAWAVFPLSSVVAWSPWLALATIRVVRRPSRRHVIAAALVLAALLLSGHPEIAAAECLVAAALGMAAWRRRAGALLPLSAAALAATLGASLAACQLLPFLLVAPHSLRASHGAGLPATTAPTAAAAPGSSPFFPPGQERLFLGVLSPWAFGRPFHETFTGAGNWPSAAGSYLGLVALAGMAAALGSRRRRLVLALCGLALGLMLLAARFLPFYWLLGHVPLGGVLAVDRFLPAAALPLALLAALGLDELVRRGRRAAASLAWMLAAASASLWVRHDPALVALWLLIALGVLALVLARLSDWSYPPGAAAPARAPAAGRRGTPGWTPGCRRACGLGLLAMASLLDLGSWGRDALPRGHRELFYPRTPLVTAIAGTVEGGPWRAVGGGFAVYPSLLPMYGIGDIRIDNPLALAEQLRPLSEIFDFRPEGRRYKSGFRHLDHPFLDFLNVRAVILAAPAAVPGKLELVNGGASLQVFRNPSALPRFFLPVGAELRGRDDALAGLQELRDARRVVLLREEVAGWRAPERPWDPAAVRILRTRRGTVDLLLPAAGEKLLATSLPFPAGWTAAAEGRPLRRVLVNTAYLGVVVPPGVARVDLAFVPPGFRLGAVLSVLGALAVSSLAVLGLARREPSGLPPAQGE